MNTRLLKELPDVLKVDEVSAVLNISSRQVYEMLRRGTLHGVRIGRLWRVTKTQVEAHLATNAT